MKDTVWCLFVRNRITPNGEIKVNTERCCFFVWLRSNKKTRHQGGFDSGLGEVGLVGASG